jgi:mono/diheme cytochrome c family protein
LETRSFQQQASSVQQIGVKAAVFGLLLMLSCGLWLLIPHANPYGQKVLALTGDATIGHAIFQINCSGCHGIEAQGRVGPNLHEVAKRRSPISLIDQVTSGKTPPMPQFQPSAQEMADLLSYLKTL